MRHHLRLVLGLRCRVSACGQRRDRARWSGRRAWRPRAGAHAVHGLKISIRDDELGELLGGRAGDRLRDVAPRYPPRARAVEASPLAAQTLAISLREVFNTLLMASAPMISVRAE